MAAVDAIFEIFDTIGLMLLYGWPFILLILLWATRNRWKNWPIESVIIESRGNNLIKTNDRVGKYTDPYTGLTCYRLNKSKDTIPILNFDWILHNVAVNTNFLEKIVNILRGNVGTVFLLKYGTKQYKPIYITQSGKRKLVYKEIKDSNGRPIILSVYEQFDPRRHLGALDFQVIDWDNMNFMVQEQRASFERRQKQKGFFKEVVVPLAIVGAAALVCIIMIKFSYDYALAMTSSPPPAPVATNPIDNLIPAE